MSWDGQSKSCSMSAVEDENLVDDKFKRLDASTNQCDHELLE